HIDRFFLMPEVNGSFWSKTNRHIFIKINLIISNIFLLDYYLIFIKVIDFLYQVELNEIRFLPNIDTFDE
ncbi:hypothetical protein PNU99_01670, partial [Streptococcus anginosus]|uniref:hypothetical protein n=1 Tax=Streptococcus anginosus TaxID=1328 RepID=UPI00232E87D2